MKTRDKYEGCVPEIAEALKKGLQVEAWVWDAFAEKAHIEWVIGYSAHKDCPYETIDSCYSNASLTDPRNPAKPPIEQWIGKWGYAKDAPEKASVYVKLVETYVGKQFNFETDRAAYKFFTPLSLITDPDPATWGDITYSAEDIGGVK